MEMIGKITDQKIYKDDKLSRTSFCQKVVGFVKGENNTDKGLIITVNGGYGSGKTTCLKFIEQEFSKEETNTVVYYDCWKNSITGDPLLSIIHTLIQKLPKDKISKIIEIGKKILKFGAKVMSAQTNISLPEKEQSIFDEIESYEKVIAEFKEQLKTIIDSKGRIILLLDEIDRCLPHKALEILERINHIFDVAGLTAIIAVDTKQIEKTIESIFGEFENASGYMARFIDYEFDLPYNTEIIKTFLYQKYNINNNSMINEIFDGFNIELRSKIKMLDFITLCCKNIAGCDRRMVYALAMSIKKKDRSKYQSFFGEIDSYYPAEKISINNSKTKALIDYITTKIIFNEQDLYFVKRTFLSLFMEVESIDGIELKQFMDIDDNRLSTFRTHVYNERGTLQTIIKNINELSNLGVVQ